MIETAPPPRRFHASIGELTGLVALAAIGCAWPGLIASEVVAVGFYWRATRRDLDLRRARLVSLGLVAGSVYLIPLANFVLVPWLDPAIDPPQWRREWSPFFPFAPGAMPVYLFEITTHVFSRLPRLRPELTNLLPLALASLVPAAEVGVLTLIAARSRGGRAVAATLGLLLAGLGTWLLTMRVAAMNAT